MILALIRRGDSLQGLGERHLGGDHIIEVGLRAGVASGVGVPCHVGEAVAGPEVLQRIIHAAGIGESVFRGSGREGRHEGCPDRHAHVQPSVVLRHDVGVLGLGFVTGKLDRPVGRRVIGDLHLSALRLAVLGAGGGHAAVIQIRQLDHVVELHLVSRVVDRIGRVGIPIGGRDDLSERLAGRLRVLDAQDGAGPRQTFRRVGIGEAAQQGRGSGGALVGVRGVIPIDAADELVVEQAETDPEVLAFARGLGQRLGEIVRVVSRRGIEIGGLVVVEGKPAEELPPRASLHHRDSGQRPDP